MDEHARHDPFADFVQELAALRYEGRREQALRMAIEARGSNRFPDRPAGAALLVAEYLCLLGEWDEAIAELSRGLSDGLWWGESLLRTSPLFWHPIREPLSDRPDFLEIVAEAERRREAQQDQLAGRKRTHRALPPETDTAGILVALHGEASHPQFPDWFPWRPALEGGWFLVAPQSSQLTSSDGTFGWPDSELALHEVAVALMCVADRLGPKLPVVLGGFSSGADLAVSWSLSGSLLPTSGFVAVCPTVSGQETVAEQARSAKSYTRGVVLTGETDPEEPRSTGLCGDLWRAGLTVHFEMMKGVDHRIPREFGDRLRRALDFVTSSGQS